MTTAGRYQTYVRIIYDTFCRVLDLHLLVYVLMYLYYFLSDCAPATAALPRSRSVLKRTYTARVPPPGEQRPLRVWYTHDGRARRLYLRLRTASGRSRATDTLCFLLSQVLGGGQSEHLCLVTRLTL